MHNRVRPLGWVIVVVVLGGGGLALALAAPEPSRDGKKALSTTATAPAAASKGPKAKVEKGPFRMTTTLKGVFEAADMHEVIFRPRATGAGAMPVSLTVLKAVPHGATVKKGDVLVQLDLEKIDQSIKDRQSERALAQIALREAQDELAVLEKSESLDLEGAERTKQHAGEDYKHFLTVDRQLMRESAEQMVKSATYYLEAAREELKQLQKMYRDKDLTEETEEYILKRHRQQVQDAEFSLKTAIIHRDHTLHTELPRREITLKEATVRSALALDRAKTSTSLTLPKKRLALEKMRIDLDRSGEQLTRLEQDRAAMTIRSPADGVVYYGKCTDGQWSAASMTASKLREGGTLTPDEVIMTVVSTRPLFVRATAEEKELHGLHAGLAGKVEPTGYPRLKLPARVTAVSAIPQAPGQFEVRLAVDVAQAAHALMPGMACTAKLVTYHKQDALTVPAGAVFTDDGDEDAHYVYLARKEEKRSVKVGETNEHKAEILGGLKAGDEILTSKPEGKP
jgi:multidrug efflux pump subunit AcrA (membrane-fusion protein)